MDEVTMEEYRFERLQPHHYKDLIYISKSAFEIDPGLKYYSLKNATKYCGESDLGFIAYHSSGEPAAFYGVYSYPIIYNGKKVTAVQSGDTMTHKSHTGKGLFIALAKLTYELAEKSGASFVFGFPNDNSYPGFVKKLNWIHKENLQVYKIKVPTLPFLKVAKKVPLVKPFYELYLGLVIRLFGNKKGAFPNSCSNEQLYIDHSDEFYKYKSMSGCFTLKTGETSWWLKADGFLFIGDVDRSAFADFKSRIKRLKRFAFFAGADVLIFNISPQTLLDNALRKIANPEQGAAIGYLAFDKNIDPGLLKVTGSDMDTF